MSGYIGNIPTPQATQTRDTFTATAGQTTFATSGYTPSFLDVFLNGVHLVNGTDYTASNGSDVVLTSGAAAGDTLEVVAYSTFEASDVTASSGFTVTGNLSVDGGTIKLDGNYPVGTANVALGDLALSSNVTGVNNTAIGSVSQLATTGDQNTSIGASTLRYNTSGSYNTALGTASLFNTTTASYNTGVGYRALFSNTTASGNTALGYQAAYSNTTGAENVLIGYKTGYASTTANGLTAVGRQALEDNTASNNTAIGFAVLANNTTGTENTAVGGANYGFTGGAMHLNTTGSNNTALGSQALHNNTTGNENTAVGQIALDANTTGYQNTAVGRNALGAATTGHSLTAIGQGAGRDITTGSNHTIIGRYSGNQSGYDIRTQNNYVVLSDGDGTVRGVFDGNGDYTVKGPYANPPTNSFVKLTSSGIMQSGRTGTGSQPAAEFFNGNGVVGSIYTNGSSTSFNTTSDYRLKENVVELTGATDRLKQIPVHRFNFIADADTTVDGFLAHEVQAIVPEAITGTKDEVDADGNPVYQGIDQSKLVPLLVATIKELEARIAALEAN
jgi:hypothetical protein